jgi:charged multivesicular body protein 3
VEYFFGKSLTPQEQLKEWQNKLKGEIRTLDRELRTIERDQQKLKAEIKTAAKKGEKAAAVTMAKGIVRSRHTCERIMTSKTQINSAMLELKNQIAMVKVSNCFEKNNNIMQLVGQLIRVPEIAATVRDMQKEMLKAGLVSEMMEDAIDSIDDADLDAEADAEVEGVLYEVTMGQLGQAPIAQNREVAAAAAVDAEEDDAELQAMRARLQKL